MHNSKYFRTFWRSSFMPFAFLLPCLSLVVYRTPLHPLHQSSSTVPHLVDLLVWEPLARLEILLLERRIQHAQSPYFARRGRVVALDVCFGFAVGGLEGEGARGLSLSALRFHLTHMSSSSCCSNGSGCHGVCALDGCSGRGWRDAHRERGLGLGELERRERTSFLWCRHS